MAKVPFVVPDIEVDGTTLTVDETNNRVGIGTNSPTVTLDVVGVVKGSDGVVTLTSAGAPSTTVADGALAVDTTNDAFYVRSGSAWVSVSDAGNLTGSTLASNVTGSSLTSVGTLSSLTVSGNLTVDTDVLEVDATNNLVISSGDFRAWRATNAGISSIQVIELNTGANPEDAPTLGAEFRYNGATNRTSIGSYNNTATFREDIGIVRTTGQVNFPQGITGDLAVDTNTLFVDATNNRVGIGTSTPSNRLDVIGTSTNGPNPALRVYHSGSPGHAKVVVQGDGSGGRAYDLVSGDATYTHGAAFHIVENVSGHLVSVKGLGTNRGAIGIGKTSPSVELDVVGAASITGSLTVDTNTLFVDSTNNRVGVGTTSPSETLDVVGNAEINGSMTVTGNIVYTQTMDTKTASYTVVSSDVGKLLYMNNGANNHTVTVNSSTGFSVGQRVDILRTGTGSVTVVQGTGATIYYTPALTLRAQNSAATLVCTGSNQYHLIGDLG